jgi:hypothetical protein
MLATAYSSPWQHPGIAWIAGVLLLLWWSWTMRGPGRQAWRWAFFVLEAEILIDAWLTGAWSPLHSTGRAATAAAVIFVILGDLRFFYLVERQRGPAAPGLRASLRALAVAGPVSLIVPIATAVVGWRDRQLFLAYEIGLFLVALLFGITRAPSASGPTRYVRRLVRFECAQYLTWATADALILIDNGRARGTRLGELGWALRIVANTLYYAAFVPVATWKAPAESRV